MDTGASFWSALRRERFLVVGFSERTGMHAGRLFARMGVPFAVSDSGTHAEVMPRLEGLPLAAGDIHCGAHDPSQLLGITQILLSPGVPRSIPLMAAARARGIPIWSDYDLLYPLYAHKRIAAITGTDGKTTTTMLVGHMTAPDARVVIAGNMGTAITARFDEVMACDVLVLELSSFMLEDVKRFRAAASVVLNVAEDHVDRYASLDDYEETKRAIVRHARSTDVFVQNLDDERVARWQLPGLDVRTVSMSRADAGAFARDGRLFAGGASIAADQLVIRGRHLQSNVLAAASMAVALGVPAEAALSRATTFPGVPHRFQSVGVIGGVEVIDDSKATSVQAVQRALESLADRQVVLILGGRDKMLDPAPLACERGHLRAVIGYGEAGERLLGAFAGGPETVYSKAFPDAVERACARARPGDVLLLSPACTSFDQHTDYVERGQVFRRVAGRCLAE